MRESTSNSCRFFSQHNKKRRSKRFLESMRLLVKGGTGGHGLMKFGGVGGRGGNIYLVAKKDCTLHDILRQNPRKRFTAGVGGTSSKRSLLGRHGDSLDINVPVGICVKNEHGRPIAELNDQGEKFLIARGGFGGTPINKFNGQAGERKMISLDLKLIADVGLVGFPNAGKSTFLAAISRATPKIANYPFTTIQPQLGSMEYPDLRQITVADLPGLIEGAHFNFGMGHKFLKHIERTKVLLFMVDVHGFQLKHDAVYRSAFETIMLLNKELELYSPELVHKPAMLALNKIDMDDSDVKIEEVIDQLKCVQASVEEMEPNFKPSNVINFRHIHTISAKKRFSTDNLKQDIRTLLDEIDDENRMSEDTESREVITGREGYTRDRTIEEHHGEHSKSKLF